jgi:uncharacterized protein
VSKRLLKLNVGFLLVNGPSYNDNSEFELPAIQIDDDLTLNYLRGPIRLSRTTEGILVQARFETMIDGECMRCLDFVENKISFEVEELFATNSRTGTEFYIDDDMTLDLAPLIRAETLIGASQALLCRPDCAGLCPDCGVNRNHTACQCELENLDPRFAVLKQLLD